MGTRRRARALAAVAIFLAFTCGGLNEDDLKCEDAAAHLDDCCPAIRYSFVCVQTAPKSCETGEPVGPFATAAEIACVRGRSCADLRDQHFCDTPPEQWPCR